MTTAPARAAAAVATARTALLAATADRPAHRAFVEQLLAAADAAPAARRWDAVNAASADAPTGVTEAAADALADDVLWIVADARDDHPRPYPNRYAAWKLTAARLAGGRKRAQAARQAAAPAVLRERLSFLR